MLVICLVPGPRRKAAMEEEQGPGLRARRTAQRRKYLLQQELSGGQMLILSMSHAFYTVLQV
jgi:hypothetical protein